MSRSGMLTQHLRPFAEALDERRYRVSLRDQMQNEANKNFAEAEEDLSDAATAYWDWYYEARIGQLGLNLPPNVRVLDVACGIGRLGGMLDRRNGGAGLIAFCDISIQQLRTLRSRWPAAGAGGMAQLGDVLRLPYAGESFDLVIGNSFLHHLPDVPAALCELQRVCKRGGHVVVLHEPNVYAPFWEAFPVSLYKNMYTHTDRSNFTDLWCFRADDMRRIAEEAGFAEVRVTARGLLSALFTNAYLLVLHKLRVGARMLRVPAHRLRVWLDGFEIAMTRGRGLPTAPSMLIVARK